MTEFSTLFNQDQFLKKPTVLLSIISRNEEHILPTFLGYIEHLNYPKDRISILIQTDHNIDDTYKVLSTWRNHVRHMYHKIEIRNEEFPNSYESAKGPNHWTDARYIQLLKLRQNALEQARSQWADYLLFVDGDNFLLNAETLNVLMDQQKTIIAPMLRLFEEKSGYSNYWGAMDENGYYKRVPEYFDILQWKIVGSFQMPMVHSSYLIHMQNNLTDKLQFYPIPTSYKGDTDDILIFAHSAKYAALPLHICNKEVFGYMLTSCSQSMTLEDKQLAFLDTALDYMAYNEPLIRSENAPHSFPEPSLAGFNEIYLINLKRRPDRFIRMKMSLMELGLTWKYLEAVDGKKLTKELVQDMGVVAMSDFTDPYLERPLTFGEIACFMSHWKIWNEMVERNLELVFVLEDDIRFEFDFRRKLTELMRQADKIKTENKVNWDLMYLGRKHMAREKEYFVQGSNKIVWARYSYWTLGYIITLSGAKKLIAGNPLPKLVPVDEYIPIMFDSHPEKWISERFSPRNLVALSAEPLLMYPTHYVGDDGYFSDTEDTLSHEGQNVEHFREKKELETAKTNKSPKTEADTIQPPKEKSDTVVDINQAIHAEL